MDEVQKFYQVLDLGGGWFQLPNGEKVQGKDEVDRKMREMLDESSSKVCVIVGYAPSSRHLTPFHMAAHGWEFWGINDLFHVPGFEMEKTPWSRWFQIHNTADIGTRLPHMHDWLMRDHGIPIYMQQKYPAYPNSVEYPLQEVIELTRDYLTNTISYELGLALLESVMPAPDEIREEFGIKWVHKPGGFKQVHLYGVDMATDTEFAAERPSCEYYVGLLEGVGIPVFIPRQADLMKAGRKYGYEGAYSVKIKMRDRNTELQNMINRASEARNKANEDFWRFVGAQSESQYMYRNWTWDIDPEQEWTPTAAEQMKKLEVGEKAE